MRIDTIQFIGRIVYVINSLEAATSLRELQFEICVDKMAAESITLHPAVVGHCMLPYIRDQILELT